MYRNCVKSLGSGSNLGQISGTGSKYKYIWILNTVFYS